MGRKKGKGDDGGAGEDRAAKLGKCKALEKLKAGQLHTITVENVAELFDVLDETERGELTIDEISILKSIPDLKFTQEDIDGLVEDCTKNYDGDEKEPRITKDALYGAFHQGTLVERAVMEELGAGPKSFDVGTCTRDELLEFLEHEDETMDALCSLPITMLAFVLFFVLVQEHLAIGNAYSMQSAIFDEIDGEGKPFIGTYIHDVPSFWVWMTSSFVGAHFKSSKDKLKQYPVPGRFVVYNQMIGGMQLVKTQSNIATDCGQGDILGPFYDTLGPSMCQKGGESNTTSEFLAYHMQSDELIGHLTYLDNLNWVDMNTRNLDFTCLYYNAHLGAFTDFHLTFDWFSSGQVYIQFGMETWVANPYGGKIWLLKST